MVDQPLAFVAGLRGPLAGWRSRSSAVGHGPGALFVDSALARIRRVGRERAMAKPVDVGVDTRVGPRTIKASRFKASLQLVMSLVFVAVGLMMVRINPVGLIGLAGWLVLLFFGPSAAILVVLLVRRRSLELDAKGFTLRGGLIRLPRKVLWRDIEPFFLYRLPKGGKMIGYKFVPASRKEMALERADSLEADDAMIDEWPRSPEKMVEDLNAYRHWALGTV